MFAAHRVGTPSTLADLDAGCTLLQTANFQTQAEALVKLPLRQVPALLPLPGVTSGSSLVVKQSL